MLLILGLDGATLDLVEPWAADGTLPNLARLLREGAWGRLASTVPAATFPSWTSFMTGVNPGTARRLRLHAPRPRRLPRALRQLDLSQGAHRVAPAERRRSTGQRARVARHLPARADQRLHGQRLRHAGDDARRRQLRASAAVSRRRWRRPADSRSPTSRSSPSVRAGTQRALASAVRRHRAQGAARRTVARARALGLLHAAVRRVRHRRAPLLGLPRRRSPRFDAGAPRRSAIRSGRSTRRSTPPLAACGSAFRTRACWWSPTTASAAPARPGCV